MLGIVYKSIDYKECDKIVYLYTESGDISIQVNKARLYKSKNFAFTNLLTLVDFNYNNGLIKRLSNYDVIDNYLNIKNDYHKLLISLNIISLIKLDHNISHNKLFNFLNNLLNEINISDHFYDVYYIFLIKMLKVFGILPDINNDTYLANLTKYISINSNNKINYFRELYYGEITTKLNVKNHDILKLIEYYENFGLTYFDKIKEIIKV